eukprot:887486-Rhodomonas_salina.5
MVLPGCGARERRNGPITGLEDDADSAGRSSVPVPDRVLREQESGPVQGDPRASVAAEQRHSRRDAFW